MKKWIFGSKPISIDVGLLLLRLALGFGMLTHGLPKLLNYAERVEKFSDPLGLGSEVSLILAIFAEVFCSILLILGGFTRIALIPLIVTFVIVVFIVHGDDSFGQKEKALLYLIPYLVILFTGPGKFSLDRIRNS
ncbi:MAG: DoxX family protein [Flammeovirgaceae bacterium]|nr:DoxX family protein [Flammeovirgaceae bacterium]